MMQIGLHHFDLHHNPSQTLIACRYLKHQDLAQVDTLTTDLLSNVVHPFYEYIFVWPIWVQAQLIR